jgi:hypothetical protein
MPGHWTRLHRHLRLKRPDPCPMRIPWVYHLRHSCRGERKPRRKESIIIDSIPLFVSRVMAEAIASYA